MQGLFMRGISDNAQGSPPIFALIWIRILLQIERKFFPLEMVFPSITCEGIGLSVRRSFLIPS